MEDEVPDDCLGGHRHFDATPDSGAPGGNPRRLRDAVFVLGVEVEDPVPKAYALTPHDQDVALGLVSLLQVLREGNLGFASGGDVELELMRCFYVQTMSGGLR
ncbi:hypothetical protein HNO80_17255 [Arthrobacter sp. C9C5]|nr:hypothetical protein [Arthrobacter sp. C9C5]